MLCRLYIFYVQDISQVASIMIHAVDLSLICFHIHISSIFCGALWIIFYKLICIFHPN